MHSKTTKGWTTETNYFIELTRSITGYLHIDRATCPVWTASLQSKLLA